MCKCAQLKDLGFLIVTVPKIFKIGQKLTEIWPKNYFFKNTYVTWLVLGKKLQNHDTSMKITTNVLYVVGNNN